MKKRLLPILLLGALVPGLSSASELIAPPDRFGALAVEYFGTIASRDLAPMDSEDRREHKILREADGGILEITYAISAEADWHVASFDWTPVAGARHGGLAKTGNSGAPIHNPDPNPPPRNYDGTIGDNKTNTFRVGDFMYTVSYVWTVREGVLGWYINSFSATYKPQTPPPPPHQEQN